MKLSNGVRVDIIYAGSFIGEINFDMMPEKGNPKATDESLRQNITVKDAKALRKALKKAIKEAEGK